MRPGDIITVDVEKATAGGRMLARHHGQIAFVAGAIPGERVDARVTRVAKGVIHAEVTEVRSASPDRRSSSVDWRCGGNVLSHIAPARQVQLKGEIIDDAFRRVARLPLPSVPDVVASPEHGYRMRARLHVQDGRIGFLRENTHELCDVEGTGQLLPETSEWMRFAADTLRAANVRGLRGIELAENAPATERACHLDLVPGDDPARYARLGAGLTGLSAHTGDSHETVQLSGKATVEDRLRVARGDVEAHVHLTRDVRAFFQGNRYLLETLVGYVAGLVPPGPVVDLYAGVGLFGLSLAALGHESVTLVEGDRVSGASLVANAVSFGAGVQVQRMSVEHFLAAADLTGRETAVVDPPRTGLSADALSGLIRRRPACVVYVSCDAPTLARDARVLTEAGYRLDTIRGFDLFPNTAHVESVSKFVCM